MKLTDFGKIKEFLTTQKARNVFIVIAIVALIMIFAISMFDGESSDSQVSRELTADNYQNVLETELEAMVENVSGAGESKIMLTLDNSYEYVYLDDGETLRKINEPEIRGVVVACEGGESAVVKEEVCKLLTTVLGVSSTKVYITKLK